jgi:hypothetical protein
MIAGSWRNALGLNLQHVADALEYGGVTHAQIRFVDARKAGTGRVIVQLAADQAIIGEDESRRGLVMLANPLHGLDDRGGFTMKRAQGGANIVRLKSHPPRQQHDARNYEPQGGVIVDSEVGTLDRERSHVTDHTSEGTD